jgi:hypothetical protein
MIAELGNRFTDETGVPAAEALCFQPVYWGPILQVPEDVLWERMKAGGELDFTSLRRFIVSFAADALAYQPLPGENSAYDRIHAECARSLKQLAAAAGPAAPLVVIAHSLGTVISSNFFYDHAKPATGLHGPLTLAAIGGVPSALEKGETLTSLITMGSPIALWSLRFTNFGKPITVPAPALAAARPALAAAGGWENYYDPDDVIGYPLKELNDAYRVAILRDVAVNVGSLLTSWNPLSHTGYWTDNNVTKPVAARLADIWRRTNA